jgi:hypothetical protein
MVTFGNLLDRLPQWVTIPLKTFALLGFAYAASKQHRVLREKAAGSGATDADRAAVTKHGVGAVLFFLVFGSLLVVASIH